MKPSVVKTPALQQIYNQKYQYQQHKQKLMKIYKDRRSQLGCDSNRITSFESIKQFKTKSFVHKFNEQSMAIAKQNQRLVGKLESVKTSLRNSTSQQRSKTSYGYITPFVKSRMLETEKQNMRISNRMRNMSSSLNQKNFIKDYAKSQKIKNRLMKYTEEDSRVFLKSQRYFGENQQNQSVLSHSKDKNVREGHSSQPNKLNIKTGYRKSAISHYKKQDILKNKIDTTTSSLTGIKARSQYRPNTSIQLDKVQQNQNNFFTTQPHKQRKIGLRKVYVP